MPSLTANPAWQAGLGWAKPMVLSLSEKVIRAGSEPVSPASAAAFRIIFGVVAVAAVVRFSAMGWISDLYIEPAHHFSYYGFGWVRAWPDWGMYLHFALLGLSALCVALGYRWRLSIAAFFILFTYVELIDRTTYLNHYYFVSLISFLMIFLPLSRAASLDRLRDPLDQRSGTIPKAAIWTLRAQVGIVYLFAGIAKLNPDWLFNADPLGIWLYNNADTPLIGALFREHWLPYAMSWAGAFFDLTIVGWLLWRRTRPYAYAVLAIFHIMTAMLFPPIGMFPLIMAGAALIFFDPDWPVRTIRWLRRRTGNRPAMAAPSPSVTGTRTLSWPVRLALVLGAGFLAVQLLMPLRHLAYPGNVRWNEEGYRFSWRVLVTEKVGLVKFRVTSQETEGEVLVHPDDYFTPTQVERMSYQPDMILMASHTIRDDFLGRGHEGVEVRADAFVTYNGRPKARLIDPGIDLARIQHGIAPKPWILDPPSKGGG